MLGHFQALAQTGYKAESVQDLSARATKERRVGAEPIIYILVFSTTGCPYCEIIRRSHLPNVPERANGKKLAVKELWFDRSTPMVDFEGGITTYRDFARRLGVKLSPTLIAFDEKGQQLGDPLIGVASIDFYSFYLDQLVSRAVQTNTKSAQ